ncbi:predicted protein [Phaeodactylum tricornutum CCAP 1055/1]|jgi:UBX domain-containing protein 1|uniref:Uncharacterized protein n=3 Tax=Phaeodactylum tricornutum TaxID=2850 RepID=B7FUL9_PHATC|nr:predicted protein [Phaeodactylum tricornutum CCAP 1055/1]EEC50005.1 predicted protein [Phaeodactylum tricornutum CCAP 1055/1]|eukprot:XP_002178340.1 predicted protein [Phaeodactylum tricornutum CCAP 1055/1]
MSNVHGLFSGKKDDSDSDDDANNRFVGGIGDRGGGSGLAVQPNMDEGPDRDAVFGLAENATAEDSGQSRRTITMYRDGFVVDDGPYRRLEDPENAEFLRHLAMGRTPRELVDDAGENVTVGLIDKRSEEYVEEFRSFSGQGTSLGTSTSVSEDGRFDPASLVEPPALDENRPTTSIAVRLLNGSRRVVKINTTGTVANLASSLRDSSDEPFRLVSGFPPKPLQDGSVTIEDAGLKGAQVSMQKA